MTATTDRIRSSRTGREGPVGVGESPFAVRHPLCLGDAAITDGLWGDRQRLNREVLLPGAVRHLEAAGNFDNLRAAAGQVSQPFRGPVFMDSDVYKWLEAIGWELARRPSEPLAELADEAIALVESAQQDDGYLNSYYQVARPGERWSNLAHDHELYCAGHLIQGAIAHARGRGDERLLAVARRFADHIDATFRASGRPGTPGHPEIETALVELYRLTRERRYLALAQYFVDQRGQRLLGPGHFGPSYYQDHVPVRAATEITGHAVRALYLNAGVTDIYLETGERELFAAMLAQWGDMTTGKTYLTGGLGAHHQDEAFGDAYELPPDRCYGETCAAIASVHWNWRMLLATGEARYADLLERTLFNGFLTGLAIDGSGFSYVNPLQVRSEHRDPVERGCRRQPWYEIACCPPNAMRLLASLDQYLATVDAGGVQLHQFAPARLRAVAHDIGAVELEVTTEYPWEGDVRVRVLGTPREAWALSLRVPAWAHRAELLVAGQRADAERSGGYLTVRRRWQPGDEVVLALSMQPRLVHPHPRIDAVRGCVAIERGPLVYCVEQTDLPTGVSVDDIAIDPSAPPRAERVDEPVPNLVAVKAAGVHAPARAWSWPYAELDGDAPGGEPTELTAIPYGLWGNRAEGAMRVWIPRRS